MYLLKILIEYDKNECLDLFIVVSIIKFMHLNIGQMKVAGKWRKPAEGIMLSGISEKEMRL